MSKEAREWITAGASVAIYRVDLSDTRLSCETTIARVDRTYFIVHGINKRFRIGTLTTAELGAPSCEFHYGATPGGSELHLQLAEERAREQVRDTAWSAVGKICGGRVDDPAHVDAAIAALIAWRGFLGAL
ncbi:hypothetical protein [Amycolatopsis magusensis]|uniref:hypothetical protein n=1 Tax=Amycolatopsis magusensis TaxID=882444 RepID=UPI0037936325